MTARELDEAAGAVSGCRRRARDSAVAAALAAALVPAAALLSGVLAVTVGIGAAALALRTIGVIARRRLLVERLSLEPEAQAIDEVRTFAARLASPTGRAELARDIRSMLRTRSGPRVAFAASSSSIACSHTPASSTRSRATSCHPAFASMRSVSRAAAGS